MSEEKKNNQLNSAKKTIDKSVKKLKKTKVSMFSVLVVLGIALIFVMFVIHKITSKPGPQEVDIVPALDKIVKNSTLSTYEVVYNGVSVVENQEKPGKVDYYVAYEATVKAGFDFKKLKIEETDKENHVIKVTVPGITLQEPKVKIENLEYIIVNNKIKKETLSAAAYDICIDDVKEESAKQTAIYDFAKDNAEKLIEGLMKPFIDQLDNEYTIEFEWGSKQ